MAENRVIGRGNGLPWHLPADMKRFKALTMGHPVIMGRKTFETLTQPLPGRRNIVLTRAMSWNASGTDVAHTLDQALARASGDAEVFVAGGAEIFRQALPLADRIYLTLVHGTVAGDATFPDFPVAEWTLAEEESHPADDRHAFAMTFQRFERRNPSSRSE